MENVIRQDIRDVNGLTEQEFLEQYDSSVYEKPSLTADIIIFKIGGAVSGEDGRDDSCGSPEILLIKRNGHPFIGHLALPGGFAEKGETIEETAARELEEETGVTGMKMELVGIYSRPGRDPRGWTVTAAYMATVHEGEIRPVAGDDAREVCWATVAKQGDLVTVLLDGRCVNDELGFDHHDIITDAFNKYEAE